MAIVLNPSDGLRNVSIFPSKPGPGAAAREQFMNIIDQIVSQANTTFDSLTNTASLNGNGWFKDTKTGLIIQWGGQTINTGGTAITYPIAFPNAVYCITASASDTAGTATANYGVANTAGVTLYTNKSSFISWIAIGK